jgi:hypothetical protein
MGLALLPPWTDATPNAEALASELQREVGPDHPLFGRTVHVLARRGDNDDVLFEVPALSHPYAVVHLTWKGQREQRPVWPHTVLFHTLQQWAQECMRPDHLKYTSGEPVD